MKFSGLSHIIVLGTVLLGTLSCKIGLDLESKNSNLSEAVLDKQTNIVKQPQKVFDLWQIHVQEETKNGDVQQGGCMPTHFPAEGSSKGIVVLFHGFTACPQQYFIVGPEIAKKGYDVFIPLIPGQGRIPKAGLPDDYALPKGPLGFFRYKNHVHQIVQLAEHATGSKIVGGLSGGASLATAAAIEGKQVWNRALIMAPFFKFPHILNAATPVINRFYPQFMGPRPEECLKELEVEGKRRGMCTVSVESTMAMLEFGAEYSKKVAEIPFPIQFVGAEFDPVIDNQTLITAYKEASKAHQKSQICFYKRGVPHSMMSRKENLESGHWWLNSLEKDLVQFVTDAAWFPTDPKSKSWEFRYPRCLIDD